MTVYCFNGVYEAQSKPQIRICKAEWIGFDGRCHCQVDKYNKQEWFYAWEYGQTLEEAIQKRDAWWEKIEYERSLSDDEWGEYEIRKTLHSHNFQDDVIDYVVGRLKRIYSDGLYWCEVRIRNGRVFHKRFEVYTNKEKVEKEHPKTNTKAYKLWVEEENRKSAQGSTLKWKELIL